MAKIVSVEVLQVDLAPKVKRSDAIQSFQCQETPMVRVKTLTESPGLVTAIPSAPAVRLSSSFLTITWFPSCSIARRTRSSGFGATFSSSSTLRPWARLLRSRLPPSLPLWDLRGRKTGLPLHLLAGGARDSIECYYTEGGWIHIEDAELVEEALRAKERGFGGTKIKIGKPHVSDDVRRLSAVRAAVGPAWEIMTDANQGFT